MRFALPVPQIFRILSAHIHGPRRLEPGEHRPPMTPTPRMDGRWHDVEAGCPRENLSISTELSRSIKAESFIIIIVIGAAGFGFALRRVRDGIGFALRRVRDGIGFALRRVRDGVGFALRGDPRPIGRDLS